MTMRVGVASILQETNTFSPRSCTWDDFAAQGVYEADEVTRHVAGTNTEAAGAIDRLRRRGAEAVPLLRAWAMSSGRLTAATLRTLEGRLRDQIAGAGRLDGVVLSLHGAMAAEDADHADARLLEAARSAVGRDAAIGVCLDLHANVIPALVTEADALIGYRTYPHVDQAATGGRIADLVVDRLEGRRHPVTRCAKRAMLLPAEAQTPDGPWGDLRRQADGEMREGVLDVSLFPVQPWLDVENLGFAVTVTMDGDARMAQQVAERLADAAWTMRKAFTVDLVDPVQAVQWARSSSTRPVLLSESADSPTAGSAADSPAMVKVLLEHGRGLRAYVTLVDGPAVGRCFEAGVGAGVDLRVGCQYDQRFHRPVAFQGTVRRLGGESITLTGPVFHGMQVSMGRYTVVERDGLYVLLSEQPACTFDPAVFRQAGLPPEDADLIVVRSANLFRAGFAEITREVRFLDLPGASTPRLETLIFNRAPRPLYPLKNAATD